MMSVAIDRSSGEARVCKSPKCNRDHCLKMLLIVSRVGHGPSLGNKSPGTCKQQPRATDHRSRSGISFVCNEYHFKMGSNAHLSSVWMMWTMNLLWNIAIYKTISQPIRIRLSAMRSALSSHVGSSQSHSLIFILHIILVRGNSKFKLRFTH